MEIRTAGGGLIWADRLGAGEPVVLISGMSQSHEGLAGQFPLARDFELLVMDNRGTGLSGDWRADQGQEGPLTGDFAEDVVKVLDAFDVPRAHVVGFSLGGRIAQWVAARFPKRVGALVLMATSPGERHGVARAPEIDALVSTADPVALALQMYTPAWMRDHPALLVRIHGSTTERGLQRALHARATHLHDSWTSLPRITAPTLVLHGTDDQINPIRNGELLAERIPGAEFVPLAGARHGIGTECADEVNRLITAFLRAHPLTPGTVAP